MNRRGFFGRVAAAAAVAVAGKAVQAAGKVEEAVDALYPVVAPPAITKAPDYSPREYGHSITLTDEWLEDNPGDAYRVYYRYPVRYPGSYGDLSSSAPIDWRMTIPSTSGAITVSCSTNAAWISSGCSTAGWE